MTYEQLKHNESRQTAVLRECPEWVRLRCRAESMNSSIRALLVKGMTADALDVAQRKLEISRKADVLARRILDTRKVA